MNFEAKLRQIYSHHGFLAKKPVSKAFALFGAAMSTTAIVVEPAHSVIMPLNAVPGTVPYGVQPNVTLGPYAVALTNTVTGGPGSFGQFNVTSITFADIAGAKGMFWGSASGYIASGILQNVPYGATITTGMTFGASFAFYGDGASGTRILAFKTPANQLGWLRFDLGGPGGPITYLGAAWDPDPGQPIRAGVIPEPSSLALGSLGLLALGAAGIRNHRNRKKAETKATN